MTNPIDEEPVLRGAMHEKEGQSDQLTPEGLPMRHVGPISRLMLLGLGWFFVALGGIGIFLPVLPTTPFLLISLWAFSRSSPKLHKWLYTHPKAGPYLVSWSLYHVIPLKAKVLAVSLMGASWLYVTFFVAETWTLPLVLAIVMGAVFSYILTKPSVPPENTGPGRKKDTTPTASPIEIGREEKNG